MQIFLKKYIKFFLLAVLLLSSFIFFNFVSAEDKLAPGRMIPKLPKTPNDPELFNGHVYPMWGPVCQRYTYSVIYRDKEGRKPQYVKIYFNGDMINMDKANAGDNDYKKGVKYIYKFVPDKVDSNFYYFEASNGLGKTRASIIDSPDNGPVLFESAFDKNEVALIEKGSGKKIWSYSLKKEWVGGVALSDDGRYLAVKASNNIYLFENKKGDVKQVWVFNFGQGLMIGDDVKGGIDISGDGSRIVAAIGNMVFLFNNQNNQPIWRYEAGNAYNVAISKDGKYLAAATAGEESNPDSNLLILWSEKNKKPLWQYHASGNFHDVSLSDDGSFIAGSTGCPDRKGYLFSKDLDQPILKSDRLTYDSPVSRAKITSDGSLIAYSTEGGPDSSLVLLFSKSSDKPLWKFTDPKQRSSRALNITPDGKYIAVANMDGDIYFFKKEDNKPLATTRITASIGGLDIADDGSFAVVGGTDKKLYILDKNLKEEFVIPFDEFIEEVDISADGKYVAAGTGGAVYFFEDYISPNKSKIFSCATVTEPEPEEKMMQNGNILTYDNQNQAPTLSREKSSKLPGMLFGFSFAGLTSTLIIYLILARFKHLKLNKKIFILLFVLIIVSLILTLFCVFVNTQKLRQEQPIFRENFPSKDRKIDGVCGNDLCEPMAGETKESCPKDCSVKD